MALPHSSGVRSGFVVRRQWASSSRSWNSPIVISVLPMSSASNMIEVTGGERVGQRDGSRAKRDGWTGVRLHHQGAIGREALHYSRDRFTDRPSPQAVPGRKASQLRRSELAAVELELPKSRYDAIGEGGKIWSNPQTCE